MGLSNFSLFLGGFEIAGVIETSFHLQDLFSVQEFWGNQDLSVER